MPKETRKINVYADTSVFGGVFDEEFQETSKNFFNAIREKRFFLLTSELVREEIQEAPGEVRRLFEEVLPKRLPPFDFSKVKQNWHRRLSHSGERQRV